MSKEIISPNSIVAGTPDWQEGYQQGLLAGHTKSIVLIRHLQRGLSPNANISPKRHQRDILEEAMELIAKNIETNNENN